MICQTYRSIASCLIDCQYGQYQNLSQHLVKIHPQTKRANVKFKCKKCASKTKIFKEGEKTNKGY